MADIGSTLSKYTSASELSNLLESDKFGIISVKTYGAVGDGVADDTNALKQVFAVAENRQVFFGNGDTYYITDELSIPSGCKVYGNGSKILFSVPSTSYNPIVIESSNVEIRDLTIQPNNVNSPNDGMTGIPIYIGKLIDATAELFSNITLYNIKILGGYINPSALVQGMVGIHVTGNVTNCTIEHCIFEGNSTDGYPAFGIAIEYGKDVSGAPSATYHPKNVSIKNCKFNGIGVDGFAQASYSAIWVNSALNVSIENCFGDDVVNGLRYYVGDYNLLGESVDAMYGIKANNMIFTNIDKDGVGISAYSSVTSAFTDIHSTISNSYFEGSASNDGSGVKVTNSKGRIVFDNVETKTFLYGIDIRTSENVKFKKCKTTNNVNTGIYGLTSSHIDIIKCNVTENNTANASGASKVGIYFEGICKYNNFLYNDLGSATTKEESNIHLTDAVVNCSIIGNRFFGSADSIAIDNGSSTTDLVYTRKIIIRDNDYVVAYTTAVYGNTGCTSNGKNYTYYTTAVPTAGSHSVGDRTINSTPVVGQPKSWSCTVAGTSGTWVSEGNL